MIPKLRKHAAWCTIWLMQFLKIIDGVVGVISFGFVPLDLAGSLATRAFMRMVARKETVSDYRRRSRERIKKRARASRDKRASRRDDPPRASA